MSSLKSHFRHHTQRQSQDPNTTTSRHTSRIPTKPAGSESGKSIEAAHHVSKLAKRTSRSIGSPEPTVKSSTTKTAVPVTAVAQSSIGSSRRTSVTPSGNTPSFVPPNIRTPSLVSGSSVSTFESPRSVLRRKTSGAIDRYALQQRSATVDGPELDRDMGRSRNVSSPEAFDTTVLGITLPATNGRDKGRIENADLNAYEYSVIRDFTPPLQDGHAQSATPSTRFSESPFSHIPTPSSASSYSPALYATSTTTSRSRASQSPTQSRPPISGRQPSKDEVSKSSLPPVRESSTSSSNSTVRADLKLSHTGKSQRLNTKDAQPSKSSEAARRASVTLPPKDNSSVSSTAKQSAQVYPELAHLMEDAPVPRISLDKSQPPVRPTRDGTPNISDMSSPSPVVQSDLPRIYTKYHKRIPSQETPISAGSPSIKSRFGFSSRSSSRTESSRIDSAVSPPAAARAFHQGASPEVKRKEGAKLQRKDSPAVASSQSPAKTPRFGLFSRKPKGESQRVLEKPKRRPSKGPAAGTGHEGYGRFNARGRSGSVSSSNGGRSSSIESGASGSASVQARSSQSRKSSTTSKDGSELDDFLRERLKPVVLRGSGSTFSANGSSSDLPGHSLHPASSKSSSMNSLPQPHLLPSAFRESSTGSPIKRALSRRLRRPSDSSDESSASRFPSLATRRSLTRTSSTSSRSPVRVPPPINTDIPSRSTTLDSYDAEASAWLQTDSTLPIDDPGAYLGDVGEGRWLRSPATASPVKTNRKWNFFQRATSSPRQKSKGKERAVESHESQHSAARDYSSRGLAHYAVLGPVEAIGLEEVQRIAQEIETSADDSMSESNAPSRMMPYERRHSSLLPSSLKPGYDSDSDFYDKSRAPRITVHGQDPVESPELLRAEPAVAHRAAHVVDIPRSPADAQVAPLQVPGFVTPDLAGTHDGRDEYFGSPEQGHESPRHPRLSPVGRIPAVVSKRDRDRRLPDNSFSRPFARTQPKPSVKPPGAIYSQIREMASPIESSSQPVSSTSTRSDGNSTTYNASSLAHPESSSTNRTSMEVYAMQNEFFSFPPRKDSEQSYSSSSGPPSWMTAMYSQPPQQEDIWNEYNDLMDEVMPLKTPTTGSSLGAPFQYANVLYDSGLPSISMPPAPGLPPTSQLPAPPILSSVSTVLTVPQQISRFLQPSLSPLTPDTLPHFVSGYGNRSNSTLFTGNRGSLSSQPRTSVQPPVRASISSARGSGVSSRNSRGSWHSRAASLPENTQRLSQASASTSTRYHRDTQLRDIAEAASPSSNANSSNLRFGALMTSKWLSFGRVFFSPAQYELQFADEARVLVIDGLSSDWSYYVAMTYPNAQVYNLTPSSPASPSFTWPEPSEQPPPNHHQVPLASISTPFPYPKGFFTAVTFRFPTATTEAAYTACVSECKRVLRPGGHLEVAVLDLDLMNMGTKARQAVRGLKTRMQAQDQNVCLRNLSDILVRLIGRRGFESVQRCIVGVPTAGRIPRSQDVSSASSDSSGKPIWHREARTSKSQEFSFADLLEDAKSNRFGDGKSNDEAITKMVAKVGRWWYSSCYEKSLLPRDHSIWSDPTLLRECERQGTSFRLLICHAQKPTQARRRTVSV